MCEIPIAAATIINEDHDDDGETTKSVQTLQRKCIPVMRRVNEKKSNVQYMVHVLTLTRFLRDDDPGLLPPSLAIAGWGLSTSSSLEMRPELSIPSRINDADSELVTLMSITRHLLE